MEIASPINGRVLRVMQESAGIVSAGTPLLEIVSEPDMRSAQEAVAFARALHEIVTWRKICDGNMQEGSFRCDANVSVRPEGSNILGTRCEIKNLNSFRFMELAIEFEVRRPYVKATNTARVDLGLLEARRNPYVDR